MSTFNVCYLREYIDPENESETFNAYETIYRNVPIKYLKKLGFDCDDNGRIKLTTDGRHTIDIVSRMINEEDTHIKSADLIPMSNKIGQGGTKPDNRWKIEASKNFTIAPAYNKGPYMVVAKEDIKTAGRKV